MLRQSSILAVLALLAAPLLSLAQQTQQSQSSHNDTVRYLAGKMMLANSQEIEIGKMVAKHASHNDVRQFAERLVEEHQGLNEELKQRMPELAKNLKLCTASQTAKRADQQKATDQQHARGGSYQLLCITEQAAQNHLDMTTKMLKRYEGQEQDFAMAFLGQQIAAHTWLVAELDAIVSAGPEELRPLAERAMQVSQGHLEKARQLAQKYEDDRRARRSQESSPSLR